MTIISFFEGGLNNFTVLKSNSSEADLIILNCLYKVNSRPSVYLEKTVKATIVEKVVYF